MRRWSISKPLWIKLPQGGFHPFGLSAEKAVVLLRIGRWSELEGLYDRDLAKAEESGLRPQQAYLLMKQGELYCRRNRSELAEKKLTQARDLFSLLGDEEERARCENGLAGVYISLKQYDRAESMIDRAIERAAGGDEVALSWQLNNKAVICKRRGQLERALELMKERMAIAQRSKRPREIAISHLNLGVVYLEIGDYDLAFEHNQECARISRKIGDMFNIYYALYNMAVACERKGRRDESLALYQDDLALARQLGDGPGEDEILKDIDRIAGSMKGT